MAKKKTTVDKIKKRTVKGKKDTAQRKLDQEGEKARLVKKNYKEGGVWARDIAYEQCMKEIKVAADRGESTTSYWFEIYLDPFAKDYVKGVSDTLVKMLTRDGFIAKAGYPKTALYHSESSAYMVSNTIKISWED